MQAFHVEETMKTETFYAGGRLGRNTAIEVMLYEDCIVASAEKDHITEQQFLAALCNQHPEHDWTCKGTDHYWLADGRRK